MLESTGLTREQVVSAYRLLLSREPESDEVIESHIASYPDLEALGQAIRGSAEFNAGVGTPRPPYLMDGISAGYWAQAHRIDYDVPTDTLKVLAERVRREWTKLGEEEPYWSVLTDDSYRTGVIDDIALAAFHESGRKAAELVDLTTERTGIAAGGTCLELGCGVGRITRHLADRFDKVIAVDISAGNLRLCHSFMESEKVGNVENRLISAIDDLSTMPDFDYFYSVIVLQHNPPPVQYEILKILLPKIRSGGSCVFQTVADLPHYGFDTETYLATAEPEMEIHSLPMIAVLTAIREAGLIIDQVRMDPWMGLYGSYTFAAHRS